MQLGPGARLGPYEIVCAIGAGGMGEVYRARDTRLQRDVAIKVLPEAFAADPDRLARFEREAQLLASLNHPHIAAIYGLEERALVLELVEGETLANRIARGPIPIDEALPIAGQIAEALETAHEQGIIHRDLKPSNIKVSPEGDVKVLDFGLAKLTEPRSEIRDSGSVAVAALTMSPTITSPMITGVGVLLGTAAYMAPEQAKGRPADKRSDIWAFGCVLYEMLTGRRAFEGEDVADTLAAVLRAEPDWSALPADTPPHVRPLVKSCLDKDRKTRIPDISAVRFLVEKAASPDVARAASLPGTGGTSNRIWQAAAALLAVTTVAAAVGWWHVSARPIAPSSTRFFVYPPDKTTIVTNGQRGTSVSISPDGSKLAFTARDASGKVLLWIRPIDALTAQPLPGTDDASYPFWSPDSRFVAFFAQQKLQKIAASGGPPQTLCNGNGRGGAWNQDGTIVFNTGPSGTLSHVSSAGGQPSEFMRPANGQGYAFPWFLPDGRHFLFYAYAGSTDKGGVFVGSLDSADSKRLTGADTAAVYDSQSHHLLFVRQGTLLAQRFDPALQQLAGEPMAIAEPVEARVIQAIAAFSVSNNGILAYGVGVGVASDLQMAWFDRHGKQVEAVGPPGNYRGVDLAPDGQHVAAHRHDGNGGDIWVTDLARGTTSRFTFDASQENSSPIWSPDGATIAYASVRNGKPGIYRKPANNAGVEERLIEFESQNPISLMSWSPDGRAIVYDVVDPKTREDLWILPLSGNREPSAFMNTTFNQTKGQISRDGKWIVYTSNETSPNEIYVQSFPAGAGKWQVSTNGGVFPRWRADGRELFYMTVATGGKMIAVEVQSNSSTFEARSPRELFDSSYVNLPHAAPYQTYAVSADGQRFLIPVPSSVGSDTAFPIAVIENWAAGIAK